MIDPAQALEPVPHHKLPESCWSCDHCTVYGNEWGCGRPPGTTCPEGRDIAAKDARTLHLERLARQRQDRLG